MKHEALFSLKDKSKKLKCPLLSFVWPMDVDYVVIGFDMEVQPLVTPNAAWPLCKSAICIDVVSNHLLFAHMPWALLA